MAWINSWIHFLAMGVTLMLEDSWQLFSRISINEVLYIIASSSSVSMVVFQIFLFGVFKILFNDTLSTGFKKCFIYPMTSLISFLSKNLNAQYILYGIPSWIKSCSKGED